MKILLTCPDIYNSLFGLERSLIELDHKVKFMGMKDFLDQCNYLEKKIFKFGFKSAMMNYKSQWNKNFLEGFYSFQPDVVLVINGGEIIMDEVFSSVKKNSCLIAWFFDSVRRDFISRIDNKFFYYDKIWVFEKNDIQYLKKKYGIEALYCPVGYNNNCYFPKSRDRDIDIVFVGNPTENRLLILREVAKYVNEKNLKMELWGSYYNNFYFWKKYKFNKKEPILSKYIINQILRPEKVAELYQRTKICINIHVPEHEGLNPRVFEIMATKSFQLIDHRKEYDQLIKPNIDAIIYTDVADLINKISYYLTHEKERNLISENGYNQVVNKLDMNSCLSKILFDPSRLSV